MAAKRKRSRKRARKTSRGKAMQVVSLKSALHMVKQAERRIRARRVRRRRNPGYSDFLDEGEYSLANPIRHFPKLKGRGRPAKVRTWDMVTRLENGMIAERRFKATKDAAYARAQRISVKKFHGSPVKEVVLDDGR